MQCVLLTDFLELLKNKVVIITGASSGIGKALAIECAGRGGRVVLAARNEKALEEVINEIKAKGGICITVPTDVTSESECRELIQKTVAEFGGIDILINNAGISMRALFDEMKLEVFNQVMDINFRGSVYCTYYALPHLLKSGGSLVGISSIAGQIGLPARSAYSASKYAMQGFLDALRVENRKRGLHVLTVLPGYTESEIRKRALNERGEEQLESPLEEGRIMSAAIVASCVADAIAKRKRKIVLTMEGKLAVFLNKFAPSIIDILTFRKVSGEKGSPLR